MSDERIGVSVEVEDKFTSAFNKFNDTLKQVNDNLDKAQKQAEKNNNSMSNLASNVAKTASAFAGFSVIKGTISGFAEAEQHANKLNRAFENSRGGIGLTKKELDALGKTLESKSLFSGEAIADVQAKLIAFKNIGGDTFKQATQWALDYSQATGTDATASAMMLGKALSNPVEGLNALKKAGETFNLEQELMIQKMVESGNIQGAQKIIMDQVAGSYRGQAEEATKGVGVLALMANKFGDLGESVGETLWGYIQPFANFINDEVIPILQDNVEVIGTIIGALSALVIGINGVSLAMSLLTKSNLILLGISAAVAGVVLAFKNWDTIVEEVGIGFAKLQVLAAKVVRVMANFVPGLMPFKKEFDGMIDNAKKKVAELEETKKVNADKRRAEEKEKEEAAAKQETEMKLAEEKKFQEMMKKLNQQNKNEVKQKKKKEADDAFQKKVEEYDNLSKEDIAYLRDSERRQRQQKTRQLQLERMSYNMLSKEDHQYIKEKEEFEVKESNQKFRKDQQIQRRRMTLSKKVNSDWADFVIGEEQRVANEKQAQEFKKMAIEQGIGNARFEASKEFFGQMSQLQAVKSREMFEIGKAAAIGSAVINTYEGITKTLATYPFPLSAAMAAAQAALGFAQVQQISSQSPAFENGGIVPGNSYTGDQVNARVNSGEMILNQRQQKNMFDSIDKGQLGQAGKPQQVNYITNVKMYGNGDKTLKKMMEKTIEKVEKRKLQKQQFVRGRFAT